jgi:hypothetical protein
MIKDPLKHIPVLYHFTDRRNLELIRKLGGLYQLAEMRRKGIAVPAPRKQRCTYSSNPLMYSQS